MFSDVIQFLNNIAWGPWMLILLVGTGIYLTIRTGFLQIRKFGYAIRNTLGKAFNKEKAGSGEITPFQAVTTALAATVGTGNIVGVTGAIAIGGPGAVFWMWISALFGMLTKYAEVVLSVRFREKNAKGDWVGGPMYYIKNGLGEKWKWLAVLFCVFASLAAFGIGNMTQVNTIVASVNTAIEAFGGNIDGSLLMLLGKEIPVSSVVIGVFIAILVMLVLFGGMKRIASVTEKLIPVMAVVYILSAIVVIVFHLDSVGSIFAMIFRGAFQPQAVIGGTAGAVLMTTIQKGVGRGVFSNEAGLGSAPMAHAATSESDPVKQGLFGIFEVFVDTIVICTLTSFMVLCAVENGTPMTWGQDAGAEFVTASFSMVFGQKIGSMIVAVSISLFALSTILGWSLYGIRTCEFLLGHKAIPYYKACFILMIVVGATMELDMVWNIADTLNGFMAIPNLIAVIGLSGVVIRLTKAHFLKLTLDSRR